MPIDPGVGGAGLLGTKGRAVDNRGVAMAPVKAPWLMLTGFNIRGGDWHFMVLCPNLDRCDFYLQSLISQLVQISTV